MSDGRRWLCGVYVAALVTSALLMAGVEFGGWRFWVGYLFVIINVEGLLRHLLPVQPDPYDRTREKRRG